MKKRVCFFANIKNTQVLREVNFYAQDIKILQDLGYEVIVVNNIFKVFLVSCDFYFVWWWTYAIFPLISAKLRRKPVIITGTFNISNPYHSFHSRPFIERFMIRTALKFADANILVSEFEQEKMKETFGYKNLHCIPHIVEAQYQALDMPVLPKEKVLLSVAWIQKLSIRRKCIDIAIKAMALIKDQIPGYKYAIIGRFDDGESYLRNLIKENNLEDMVELRGSVSEADKIESMQRCSLFISPTFYEGFGLAMLEAASCGAVVLSTMNSAVPYVLGDIPVYTSGNTPREIADAILKAIHDPGLIEQKAMQGIMKSKISYSYPVRLEGIKKIIRSVNPGLI